MQTGSTNAVSSRRSRRPFSLTLLTALILLIGLIGLVRLVQTIRQWSFLSSLEVVSPVYLLVTGLFWGGFGLATGVLLWRRWKPARLLAPAFLCLYSGYYWFDRLFVARSAERAENWSFVLVVNLLVLMWAFWAVNRPKGRFYFEQRADQPPVDPPEADKKGCNG